MVLYRSINLFKKQIKADKQSFSFSYIHGLSERNTFRVDITKEFIDRCFLGSSRLLRALEGNQNKNNCIVSNFYDKMKIPALFPHLFHTEKCFENFNLL